MLRVTPIETRGSSTLKLEGKLSGPWVDEMERCWDGIDRHSGDGRVKLNLEELTYVDNRGRDLLLRMEQEGASLAGASEFLRHLLSGDGRGRKHSARKQNKNEEIQNGSPLWP